MRELRKGLSRQVIAALTIAWVNGVLALRRVPLWIISYLLMPLTLLFFFIIYGNPTIMKYALIGGTIMIAVSNGISILGDAAFYRIYVKYQDLLVATPIRPTSYIIGLSLSMLVFSAPGLALFVILMWLAGMLTPLFSATLAACLILTWAFSSFMGFTISTFFKQLRHVWPLVTILSLVLSVLPPIYYPATILPRGLQWIGALAPTGAAAMILHHVAGLANLESTALIASIASAIGYTVAFMLLSLSKMRWREK
ncbi:MAG: ABC transporter permease [Thermoprotei archaeon]|nr:MAG: ABC transporter permease [Thermoprotei archaeon]